MPQLKTGSHFGALVPSVSMFFDYMHKNSSSTIKLDLVLFIESLA